MGGALPSGSFDLVTAFEALEHTPEPVTTMERALGLPIRCDVMLFSTLSIDHLPPRAMDHWYIARATGMSPSLPLRPCKCFLGHRVSGASL
jgi:hypothetical protein